MDLQKYLSAAEKPAASPTRELISEAISSIPSAAAELASEAWNKPLDTAVHAVATVGSAAAVGTILGALIPSRGPSELITGAIFTAPILFGEIRRFQQANDLVQQPGADIHAVGKQLARGALTDTADIGLSFAGAHVGSSLGQRLATSDTAIGDALQKVQRKILKGENAAMVALDRVPDLWSAKLYQGGPGAAVASEGSGRPRAVGDGKPAPLSGNLAVTGELPAATRRAWFAPNSDRLNTRLAQVQAVEGAPGSATTLQEYYGNVHGHSRYSDGMGEPKEIYASAKEGGQSFYSITDHNHLAARDGVKPNDPRAADQAGTPIIAANPIEYSQTFADAAAATEPGKFIGIVGVEMGTIGKVGGGAHPHRHNFAGADGSEAPQVMRVFQPDGTVEVHEIKPATPQVPSESKSLVLARVPDEVQAQGAFSNHGHDHGHAEISDLPRAGVPGIKLGEGSVEPVSSGKPSSKGVSEDPPLDDTQRERSHYGGVNHINLFEVPQFFEAVRQPRPRSFLNSLLGRDEAAVEVKAPDVIRYNDGDYKAMVDHLDQLTDTTGKAPVIQLNHPRFTADWDQRLDPSIRGRDYGIKSFKDLAEWRDRFGKYASLIEVITGEALNPKPTTSVKSTDLGPINMAGYIDKGLHVSPTFGRDDHFAMPNARPAGTGIFASELTKDSVMDALRQRRTVATTSIENLRGHMIVNDAHPMGTIFDQTAVNDLNIKMNIGGNLDPGAKYKVTLYGDSKIGDGTLAQPVQVKELTGADLVDTHGQVAFDQVHHKIGNSSAWYIEVQRTDPHTTNVDYMWTAPVWVEPLAGQQHSMLTRAIVGTGLQFALGLQ